MLRLASTAHGCTVSIAVRTLSGESPPARSTRPLDPGRPLEMLLVLLGQGADREPSRPRRRSESGLRHATRMAGFPVRRAGRYLGADVVGLPTKTPTERSSRERGSARRLAGGSRPARSRRRSAPASAAAATSSSRVRPLIFHEWPAQEVGERFAAGSGGPAPQSREPRRGSRVGTGELRGGSVGAVVRAAFRDHHPVTRRTGDELES